jgi:uncharacterized RDD family membrane protein YckC
MLGGAVMFCSRCGAQMDPSEAFCRSCGAPSGLVTPAVPYAGSGGAVVGIPAPPPPSVNYVPPPAQSLYAGFWLRLVAYMIDAAVLGVPIIALIFAGLVMTGASAALTSGGNINDEDVKRFLAVFGVTLFLALIAVVVTIGWLYYAYCESSAWQGTLGKKALGLFVTDYQGNRVSFGRASGRFFARLITGMVPLAIGYIMAGFTARKQALHDMIASCLVLRRQSEAVWQPPPQPTNQAL